MICKALFENIDLLEAKYLDVLEAACNIESPTSDKAAVDEVGAYLASLGEELGFTVNVYPMEKAGDFIEIVMNPDAAGKPICLSAHLDTVHPKGLFGYPAVTRDEENMYGPGVVDCKGGAVAALMAMEALRMVGFTERPVKLLLQTDEETGSSTSGLKTVRLMQKLALGADAFLNLEGQVGNSVAIIRKGILRRNIRVFGKALHSSRCYEAANAVAEAAHKIIELEKLKDIDGLTCNCGVIHGGTVANSVAAECVFSVDVRYVGEEDRALALELIRTVAEKSYIEGTSAVVEEISERPSMPYRENNKALADRMNEIYAECGLPVLTVRKSLSGSDAAYITEVGVPTVDSIGTEGGNIHSKDEFMRLSSLAECAKRIASVVYLY